MYWYYLCRKETNDQDYVVGQDIDADTGCHPRHRGGQQNQGGDQRSDSPGRFTGQSVASRLHRGDDTRQDRG